MGDYLSLKECIEMIKNIVFDMGNVLVGWTPMEFALRAAAGHEADAGLLNEALFASPQWPMADAGLISQEELLRSALERLPERLHEAMRRMAAFWPDWMQPIPGAEEFVRQCKKAGMKLYLLSNAALQFPAALESRPFYPLFDGAMVSAHEKLVKPDPRIYRRLCETFGLIPEECFFLDDMEVNVEGARSIGVHGMLFDGNYMRAREALRALGLILPLVTT